jgi:hypothetical protein
LIGGNVDICFLSKRVCKKHWRDWELARLRRSTMGRDLPKEVETIGKKGPLNRSLKSNHHLGVHGATLWTKREVGPKVWRTSIPTIYHLASWCPAPWLHGSTSDSYDVWFLGFDCLGFLWN